MAFDFDYRTSFHVRHYLLENVGNKIALNQEGSALAGDSQVQFNYVSLLFFHGKPIQVYQ